MVVTAGLGLFALSATGALVLAGATRPVSPGDLSTLFAFGTFAVVGGVLVAHTGHRIGWLCLAVGVGGAMSGFTQEYATYAAARAGLPGTELAAWLQNWLWFPFVGIVFTFLPLLFPDGHLPSRRWRPLAWLALVDIALLVVAFGLTPTGAFGGIGNPFWLIPAGPLTTTIQLVARLLTIVAGVLCAAALIVRYRSAGAKQRAQLKWVVAAVSVFAASLVVVLVFPELDTFNFVIPLLPLAVGIAMLRYDLYDIDVLIRHAIVYIPLMALLGGLYAASVALFQRLFIAITGDRSDAAIVLTTLILAAIFTPARKVLETAVERRFMPRAAAPSPAEGRLVALDDPELRGTIEAVVREVVSGMGFPDPARSVYDLVAPPGVQEVTTRGQEGEDPKEAEAGQDQDRQVGAA
jgi:hypothetical protein